jgi:hypothetical protein
MTTYNVQHTTCGHGMQLRTCTVPYDMQHDTSCATYNCATWDTVPQWDTVLQRDTMPDATVAYRTCE